MGDSTDFHYGKKTTSEGLEFVGGKKKPSLFAQYTAQFGGQVQPQAQPQQPSQPVQGYVMPTEQSHLPSTFQQQEQQQPVAPAAETDQSQDLTGLISAEDEVIGDIPDLKIRHARRDGNTIKYVGPKPEGMSKPKKVFATVGVFAALAVLGVSTLFLINNQPAVPASVKAKAGFPVYQVVANGLFNVDKKSVEMSNNGSLVYVVYQKDNNAKFVISQQSTPVMVKDDAQYQQFLSETDKFASLDSAIGKAYFTRPAGIGNDISVVVKNNDTLLFIRGDGGTSEQSWANLISFLKQ